MGVKASHTATEIPKNVVFIIMNLHEDIQRIKEMMGVIMENGKSNTITNMIDEIGLYDAIKMVGGYENIIKYINPEDISNKDKIKFIQEVTEKLSDKYGRISTVTVNDLGVSPIPYDKYENTERLIISFGKYGVKVIVNKNGKYDSDYSIHYDHISEDVLDNIFKWLLDFLKRD